MNLCHRGVLDNPTCEACSLSNETSGPLFWDCTSARETWEAAGIPIDLRGVQYREFIDLLWHLIFVQHVGMNLLKFVITTAWCKWFRRNKTRLGAPQQSCREIIHKARTMLEDVRLAHLRIPQHKDAADIRWTPPDFPKYKVNTDVAVFSNTKAVGIGVVVPDHEGAVIAALSKRLSLPLGPLEAEAKAVDEAVSFARDIGLQDIIFETGSTIINNALTGTTIASVSIDNIVTNILHKLQDFRRSELMHVRRQGNKPAHTLARHAEGIDKFVTWIEQTPSFIESLVIQDALFLSSY